MGRVCDFGCEEDRLMCWVVANFAAAFGLMDVVGMISYGFAGCMWSLLASI
jgi:hypothetical protein